MSRKNWEQLELPGVTAAPTSRLLVGWIAVRVVEPVQYEDREITYLPPEWQPVNTYGGTAKLYTTEGRARSAVRCRGAKSAPTILPVYVDLPDPKSVT